jgi:hypothetical protein
LNVLLEVRKMNKRMIIVMAVACLVPGTRFASAARFLDDFSTDTSANYIGTVTYGSGPGGFSVADGVLNMDGRTSTTYTVFHKTARLEAGELVAVFAPASNPRDFYLTTSTTTRGPNTGTEDGIRFAVYGTYFRSRTYRDGTGTNIDYPSEDASGKDLMLYIYRDTDTSYRVGYDAGDGIVVLDTIDILETAGVPGLYVGVEEYASQSTFDDLQIASLNELAALAKQPNPDNAREDVPRDVVLSWAAGEFAVKHDLYLGTDFDDVNDAGIDSDLMVSLGQSDTRYDAGILDFGQVYYWRVDEVNAAPDNTVFRGDVWRFTVEPFSIPLEMMTATASSSNTANMGPDKTINGIGLNELDQHSTEPAQMWLSGMGDATPWIQYAFDKAYKLHEMWVWNSNQLIESFVGIGTRDVVIETSIDGAVWSVLEGATLFNQATGTADYTANTRIDFAGAMARYVRITIMGGYGMLPQYGISEVRFLYVPSFAREPQPADGEVIGAANVTLSWRAGRDSETHQVHLGTDPENLDLIGTTTEAGYAAQGLDYGTTYYWSISEVNEAEVVQSHAGDIWSFSTPDYGIVDGFDLYDDSCQRIFFAWEDGLGHNGGTEIDDCAVPPSNGNGGGSIVGNAQAPFAEQTIVHAGTQSMPLEYDNAFGPSETTLALDGQDWTASRVQTLSLYFYGQAGNSGQLYVKINNSKLSYDGEAADITRPQWVAWNIDLSALNGLQNVTSLTIGIDGSNAAGMLYIDSIRLYPQRDEPGDIELLYLDNFETDTAGNYRYSDSYGSGGSFDVSGGTLNINAASGNTATVMTSDTVDFMVGQTVTVQAPARSADEFLCLSTLPLQPGKEGSHGIRLRRSSAGIRVDGQTDYMADPSGSMTLLVERTSDADFAAYYQLLGDLPTLIGEFTVAELSGIQRLHIGVQAYGGPISFDNLQVTQ